MTVSKQRTEAEQVYRTAVGELAQALGSIPELVPVEGDRDPVLARDEARHWTEAIEPAITRAKVALAAWLDLP